MRDKVRELVIEAIADTEKLTEVVDKLCDLHNVSNRKMLNDLLDEMIDKDNDVLFNIVNDKLNVC